MKEGFLEMKLSERRRSGAFRELKLPEGLTDFYSNDYLGLARAGGIADVTGGPFSHGSTGSRLLSGNSIEADALEAAIAAFHEAEAALLFNSGYDANTGLLGCITRRGDRVYYDQLCHASIRDGLRLGLGQSYSYRHNDLRDLEKKLGNSNATGETFVVTESVFSMDGDTAPLPELVEICRRYRTHLVVDEAHALGVIGERGEGLAQSLGLHNEIFARIYTYGKAAGAHGAAIAGSNLLKDYLVNFSRSFIYTTALPLSALAAIRHAYAQFPRMAQERRRLSELIQQFRDTSTKWEKLDSGTPIQGVLTGSNETAKQLASFIREAGMDVRPILHPTVPLGEERIRIILHAFNTADDLARLLKCLE